MIDIFRGLNLEGLTCRQRDVLKFLVQFQFERGYPPTVRDIGEEFAIRSPNGVMCHLKALQHKNRIKLAGWRARGITIKGLRWLPLRESDLGRIDDERRAKEEAEERDYAVGPLNGSATQTRLQNGASRTPHTEAAYHD